MQPISPFIFISLSIFILRFFHINFTFIYVVSKMCFPIDENKDQIAPHYEKPKFYNTFACIHQLHSYPDNRPAGYQNTHKLVSATGQTR